MSTRRLIRIIELISTNPVEFQSGGQLCTYSPLWFVSGGRADRVDSDSLAGVRMRNVVVIRAWNSASPSWLDGDSCLIPYVPLRFDWQLALWGMFGVSIH